MPNRILDLKAKAAEVRQKTFEMIIKANKGHIGGSFSSTDILVALFYGGILRFDSKNPRWEKRDRFLLSKGHSCEAFYVILSDLGYFAEKEIDTYQNGSILGGHPSHVVPGVEAEAGSLGHGLGIAVGKALSAKLDGKDFLTFALLGDGECCEGSIWEAAMLASKLELTRLIAIVDYNGLIVTDRVDDCTSISPLDEKWKAFGWDVINVDGHSYEDLLKVLGNVRLRTSHKPLMIIAKTVKGKGVSFMENDYAWHHGVPKGDQVENARRELEKSRT